MHRGIGDLACSTNAMRPLRHFWCLYMWVHLTITPDRQQFRRFPPGLHLDVRLADSTLGGFRYFAAFGGGATLRLYGLDSELIASASRSIGDETSTVRRLSSCEDYLMRFVKRLENAAAGGASTLVKDDLSESYPALWEYLTATEYAPGQPRVTSTLMLLTESGKVKGCVHDRDGNASAWFTSTSLRGLLDAIESALIEQTADWRAKPVPKGAGGGKPR